VTLGACPSEDRYKTLTPCPYCSWNSSSPQIVASPFQGLTPMLCQDHYVSWRSFSRPHTSILFSYWSYDLVPRLPAAPDVPARLHRPITPCPHCSWNSFIFSPNRSCPFQGLSDAVPRPQCFLTVFFKTTHFHPVFLFVLCFSSPVSPCPGLTDRN
jgi:hypothetical protein